MPEQFKTVAGLLADPKRWTQYTLSRDIRGARVNPFSPAAVSFCLAGAVDRIYSGHPAKSFAKLHKVLLPTCASVTSFNDTHTHEEVLELVKAAGI